MRSSEAPFLNLSDELLLMIFANLIADDIHSVMFVCKLLSRIALDDKLWRDRAEQHFGWWDEVERRLASEGEKTAALSYFNKMYVSRSKAITKYGDGPYPIMDKRFVPHVNRLLSIFIEGDLDSFKKLEEDEEFKEFIIKYIALESAPQRSSMLSPFECGIKHRQFTLLRYIYDNYFKDRNVIVQGYSGELNTLGVAIASGQPIVGIENLLQRDSVINKKYFSNKISPMHLAVMCNHIEIINYLATNHPSLLASTDDQGLTPLFYAIKPDRREAFDALLSFPETDISYNAKTEAAYYTPFCAAVNAKQYDLVRILIQRDANIGSVDLVETYGASEAENIVLNYLKPLERCVATDKVEIVNILSELRPSALHTRPNLKSLLDACACTPGYTKKVAEWLYKKEFSFQLDILYHAAKKNKLYLFDLLQHFDNLLEYVDGQGNTLLHVAIQFNSLDVIKRIFDIKREFFNRANQLGQRPLYFIRPGDKSSSQSSRLSYNKSIETLKFLFELEENNPHFVIDKMHRPNDSDYVISGYSMLHRLQMDDKIELAKWWIRKGADIDCKIVPVLPRFRSFRDDEKLTQHGWTPLLIAVEKKQFDMIKFLVAEFKSRNSNWPNAPVSIGEDQFELPLNAVLRLNNYPAAIVKLLLYYGADVYAVDSLNQSPFGLAFEKQLMANKVDKNNLHQLIKGKLTSTRLIIMLDIINKSPVESKSNYEECLKLIINQSEISDPKRQILSRLVKYMILKHDEEKEFTSFGSEILHFFGKRNARSEKLAGARALLIDMMDDKGLTTLSDDHLRAMNHGRLGAIYEDCLKLMPADKLSSRVSTQGLFAPEAKRSSEDKDKFARIEALCVSRY